MAAAMASKTPVRRVRSRLSAKRWAAPEAMNAAAFGTWSMFVPQKAKAMKRAKRVVLAGALAVMGLVLAGAVWWWG